MTNLTQSDREELKLTYEDNWQIRRNNLIRKYPEDETE